MTDVPFARQNARLVDILRITAAALSSVAGAVIRRATGRRGRPTWSLQLELAIAAARGAWSVMTRVGVLRWRNATEAMSPLKTSGVPLRFVRDERDGRAIQGAWLEPEDAEGRVVLYFHGGGFVFGSIRSHGEMIGAFARAARARTFVPEYRRGPEHAAPAAGEDALAAYRYLLGQGVPPGHIVLAGDSAGGTMVLNTLIALRDGGMPLPAAGVAISPWVDLACSGASFETNAPFDYVGRAHCLLAAANYLQGIDPHRPDISPLFAGSLAGLPPLLVHAGEAEVLVDQIRAFADRAKDAGIDICFDVYPGMVHVWHIFQGITPAAQQAMNDAGAFVRERTAPFVLHSDRSNVRVNRC